MKAEKKIVFTSDQTFAISKSNVNHYKSFVVINTTPPAAREP